jgi:hypothetical protein
MIKKIGKACISIIVAFCLSLIAWYFLLIKLPEHQVQGSAASSMSKDEALDLMHYHGVKVIWVEGGEWFFRRDGEDCKLTRKQ